LTCLVFHTPPLLLHLFKVSTLSYTVIFRRVRLGTISMSNNLYNYQNFPFRTFSSNDCNGYKGFNTGSVSSKPNQTVCTLNSTRSFDAISQCCGEIRGTLMSVDNSSILFCTLDGLQFNATQYYDCFKQIPPPAGTNISNISSYTANEIGSCGSCAANTGSAAVSNSINLKAGAGIMTLLLAAMVLSL